MKKILLSLCVLGLSTLVSAQQFQVTATGVNESKSYEVTDRGTYDFSYCDFTLGSAVGINAPADLSAAIFLPQEIVKKYAGAKITAIRFVAFKTNQNGSWDIENAKVFISENLEKEDNYTQDVPSVEGGWNKVELKTPFVIAAEKPLFVGTHYHTTGGFPIGMDAKPNNIYAGFLGAGKQWTTLNANNIDGNFQIVVSITGDNITSGVANIVVGGLDVRGIESAILINETFDNGSVYDLTGKEVAHLNANQKSVSVAKGVYIVKIQKESDSYVQKILVK